jgi:NACalpha-BTF3-like transcription factor
MKFNWLEVIGIGLIVISGVIAVQIYYNEKHSSCISNPLVYASKMYEERTGYPFSGNGVFTSNEKQINSPIIFFNSKGIKIENQNLNPSELKDFNLTINKINIP